MKKAQKTKGKAAKSNRSKINAREIVNDLIAIEKKMSALFKAHPAEASLIERDFREFRRFKGMIGGLFCVKTGLAEPQSTIPEKRTTTPAMPGEDSWIYRIRVGDAVICGLDELYKRCCTLALLYAEDEFQETISLLWKGLLRLRLTLETEIGIWVQIAEERGQTLPSLNYTKRSTPFKRPRSGKSPLVARAKLAQNILDRLDSLKGDIESIIEWDNENLEGNAGLLWLGTVSLATHLRTVLSRDMDQIEKTAYSRRTSRSHLTRTSTSNE